METSLEPLGWLILLPSLFILAQFYPLGFSVFWIYIGYLVLSHIGASCRVGERLPRSYEDSSRIEAKGDLRHKLEIEERGCVGLG